jgi:signal transduction histidine kinase
VILNRIFRTYTFRFAVLYVLTISLAASAISTFFFIYSAGDYFKQVNQEINTKIEFLTEQFQAGGVEGFKQHINHYPYSDEISHFHYCLTNDNGKTLLAGNFEQVPVLQEYPKNSLDFAKWLIFRDQTNKNELQFVGQSRELADGHSIVVARHFEDVNQRVDLVASTLTQLTVVMIFLGLVGGTLISARMIRRLDELNQSIATIMQGHLSERLPVSPLNGELDQLASQLNIMLERIESSMNDVREVSDNIAHDLRTPLTRLRNKLSTLEKRSSSENRDLVREMVVEADHLLSICSALLRIARVESGTKRTDFTEVDIAQIFVDVVELYEPVASVKNINLTIESEESVHIQGDKDMLFQMLVNLVDNAIKYTPEGGAIITQLFIKQGMINIIFADNGLGIPKEKYSKVFQRFYRVEESRGIHPGNGLGLSLVQAVAVLHGGQVQLSDSMELFPSNITPGLQITIQIPLQMR